MSGTQILAMLGLLVVLGVTLKVFCGPSKCSNNSYSLCPRGKKKDDEESSTQLKDSKDFSHN